MLCTLIWWWWGYWAAYWCCWVAWSVYCRCCVKVSTEAGKGITSDCDWAIKFYKFGAWQILHSHVADVSARWWYSSDVIVMHSVWYHWSQLSQARARWSHLTALEQIWHRNLGVYGPVLDFICIAYW
jgi:hypothetical protein